MRTEKAMYDLILDYARRDPRVRVVGLVGSRANPNAPRDNFQDYDITFLVRDLDSFRSSETWLDYFGPRVITQKPNAMRHPEPGSENELVYLMLFEDGNRIDLSISPVETLPGYLASDRMMVILLDKDGLVGDLPVPTDRDYWIQPPDAKAYDDCSNEFWWVNPYVAKGLARDEILYAAWHLERCVRVELLTMLGWKVGCEVGFKRSLGKQYKYLKPYLSPEEWSLLMRTYRLDTAGNVWQALFAAQALFRLSAKRVAEALGFDYPPYDGKVSAYVQIIYAQYRLGVD
ncbi:MAG: aminoglycoside 6-adenylyltransferase [Anaerolineaceae bacterium]|jgi:aminoglycoside 6-adenylyltransferase|nr:aminoglycoside 6-adenylyltransferase [Anaerolineaceae bacterium]HNX46049.1 aminoglycoside 6-adenylyltransferase [Anaerolineaceae bacterium]HPT24721.1 aminoglycoside 6-adenylyltransferase [Anaerolineaceae bacterium]